MAIAITLIGNDAQRLSSAHLSFVRSVVAVQREENLADGEAHDFFVGDVAPDIRKKLDDWAQENRVDIIIQPTVGRRKKALLADMESTIIHQEMVDEMSVYVGRDKEVKEITRRAMNNELDFKQALAERLKILKGVPLAVVEELKNKITLMEGAKELVATMRGAGAECLLVSGGFTCFIEPVARQVGFNGYRGNVLDIQNGVISGVIIEPFLDKNSKREILAETAQRLGIVEADCVTVGDGANDIPMLQAAGLGIAYRAKPAVQQAAYHNIRFANLRGLLWAQGYKKSEIIAV